MDYDNSGAGQTAPGHSQPAACHSQPAARHSRENGNPGQSPQAPSQSLDSRLRGNDGNGHGNDAGLRGNDAVSLSHSRENGNPGQFPQAPSQSLDSRLRGNDAGGRGNDSEAETDSLDALLQRQQKHRQSLAQQPATSDADLPKWAQALVAQETGQAANTASDKDFAPYQQDILNKPKSSAQPAAASQSEVDQLKAQMAQMNQLLTHQLASLMDSHQQRVDPMGSMVEQLLRDGEFSKDISSLLGQQAGQVPAQSIPQQLPKMLAECINCPQTDVILRGGVVALVGPTGVGKTTTLAKLAARYAARYGADQLGLITLDHYRIGAYEQLATYGKIIGCMVKSASNIEELESALNVMRNRSLVLIDTAGMSQRDLRLTAQLRELAADSRIPIQNYLVLSATAQGKVIAEAVKQFSQIPLKGSILTKMDEAVSLGGALSVLVREQLELTYVTNGQRVPEDLQLADALQVAAQAINNIEQEQQFNLAGAVE
nr:flagellar biosynthesis protein FlhF [Paraferrimonas sedimenticola]